MPAAVKLRTDYRADELRRLAVQSADTSQSRRLLSLAAVFDGMSCGDAARMGGMDRQLLRDWVLRFNAEGPDGLVDRKATGAARKLTEEQRAEVARIVETDPDREKDGVIRWRRIDLQREIKKRFGVEYHERYVGTLLREMGFSHISARPRHPEQDEETMEAFKKTLPTR